MGNMGTVSGCAAYRGAVQDSETLRTSSVSSKDHILYDIKKGNKGIVVSRQVDVDRSGA